MHIVTFGRTDGSAIKHLHPRSRTQALETANALSFVLFLEHKFKPSECHSKKRFEQGGFFVELDRQDGRK